MYNKYLLFMINETKGKTKQNKTMGSFQAFLLILHVFNVTII